jgi:hypothetical protein
MEHAIDIKKVMPEIEIKLKGIKKTQFKLFLARRIVSMIARLIKPVKIELEVNENGN